MSRLDLNKCISYLSEELFFSQYGKCAGNSELIDDSNAWILTVIYICGNYHNFFLFVKLR